MSDAPDRAGDFIDACIDDPDAARRMVEADPQVMYLTKIGSPILHWMVIEDFQVGTQRLLEEFHVDVEHRDESGQTALHRAAFLGRLGGARLLLKNGADAEALHEELHENPLHKAVEGEHLDVAILLIQHGARPDYRLDSATTIFHAMSHWIPESRQMLLDMLAQVGCTPESFFREHGYDETYDSIEDAFGW